MNIVIALVFACGVFTITSPPSRGAPGDVDTETVSPPVLSTTVPLPDVGLPIAVEFFGESSAQRLTVPVPYGLTPIALNVGVELPLNMKLGFLTVQQGERTLARVDVPIDQAPIVLPLAGAEVVDNRVTVTIHSYLVPLDGFCFRSESPLRLVNGTVTYEGVQQTPATVAQFLPPVLQKLTIYLPQSPSTSESDTAIQLASSTTAHYGSQGPAIAVVPLESGQSAPPPPEQPLERQVVIKEGPTSGLSLQGPAETPWLLISGALAQTGDSSIALLFSNLSHLALSTRADLGAVFPSPRFAGNTATLRDLDQPSLSATSLEPRVSIGLDQTRFGRSIHSVRVHLRGSYTPLSPDIGGQIVVAIDDETIDHWPADGQGNIDRVVTVPDRLLQRYTSLSVKLNAAGNTGRCGDFYTAGQGARLLTLTIDSDSTVESSPAAPPVPDGFQAMPQALMPRVAVGIQARSFPDTARAVAIVVGLQKRTSSTPLDVSVTSVQQTIDSPNPAIVVAADGWKHPDVVLPVSAGTTGPIVLNAVDVAGKPVTLTLDPALKFASLQTVFNKGRSMLIATSNGTSAQLDALIGWLNGDPFRWQYLRGVAVVSVEGHDPVTVDPTSSLAAGPLTAPGDRTGKSSLLWWVGAGVLAAVAAGAVVMVLRRRRS